MIDAETIRRAREIIAAASKPPYTVGSIAGETNDAVLRVVAEMLAQGEGRCFTVVIPDGEHDIEKKSLSVAITGNGPTSEANAKYIFHSHDPVGGWAACLDEIERLQRKLILLTQPGRSA